MPAFQEQAIRERAYRIWEREDRPGDRELDNWLQAECEISQAYLLDTSAFINLGLPVFAKLRGWNLYVSPYVFWERICHLDEKSDFQRAKGEFRKFEYVKILDDPRAAIEKPLGRAPDSELICRALDVLKSAKSLIPLCPGTQNGCSREGRFVLAIIYLTDAGESGTVPGTGRR
jgi:hypothetical protein